MSRLQVVGWSVSVDLPSARADRRVPEIYADSARHGSFRVLEKDAVDSKHPAHDYFTESNHRVAQVIRERLAVGLITTPSES
ncbi:hypothetical protein GCM10023171_35370 [Microbacterium panaciterrae]|uniref:Uncharacterized protein n=1 Tax=Microbacterium panaciterrae TaxID=985759 RepID=A0ABP8PS52_9MICO